MSLDTAINNDGNIASLAANLTIQTQTNNFINQSKAQRRSERRSFSMVPSTLTSQDFVGHRGLLDTVSRSLKNDQKVALYGLGGIGTSRLAAEVAGSLFPKTFNCVFWIDATNVTSYMRGMESIAVRLELPLTDDAASNVNAAKSWMETYTNGSWLLVLDAADHRAVSESRDVDLDAKESHFVQRLPQQSSAPLRTILITTSQEQIALKWCSRPELAIKVSFLELKEAGKLLRDKSGDRTSKEQDVLDLAKELDGNPSALVLAARLIRLHSTAGNSISKFLVRSRVDKDRFIAFFDGTHPSTRGLYETSLTVILFKAIETVRGQSAKACDLLFLMACLDGTSVPPNLFCHAFGWEDDTPELWAETSMLLSHGLISRDETTGCYLMPKLVRLTTRHWISSDRSKRDDVTPLAKWQFRALASLMAEYDSIQPQTSDDASKIQLKRRALLPHAAAFEQFCRSQKSCTAKLDDAQFRAIVVLAELFSSEGQYTSAEEMLAFAMESPVDWSHWRRVAMLRLAESLRNQTLVDGNSKRLKKALRLVREVEKSPDGVEADLWSTFALLYADRGRFEQAAMYQIKAVHQLAEEYGEHDLRTLESCLELSNIRWREGELEEALEEQQRIERVLQIKTIVADPENVSRLLQVQAALVRTHYSLDNLQTAVKLAEEVAEGRAQALGGLDMKTIASEKDLAQCLLDLDRRREARVVLKRIEEKLRQKFDFSHQEVQACVKRLDGINKEFPDEDKWSTWYCCPC